MYCPFTSVAPSHTYLFSHVLSLLTYFLSRVLFIFIYCPFKNVAPSHALLFNYNPTSCFVHLYLYNVLSFSCPSHVIVYCTFVTRIVLYTYCRIYMYYFFICICFIYIMFDIWTIFNWQVPRDSILQVWMGRPSNVRALNERGYRALYSSCWYLDNYKTQPMWPDYYKCDPSPYYTGLYFNIV